MTSTVLSDKNFMKKISKAIKRNDLATIATYLKHRYYDINRAGYANETALLLAVYHRQHKLVELFCRMGANPNVYRKRDRYAIIQTEEAASALTPLSLAIALRDKESVIALLADDRTFSPKQLSRKETQWIHENNLPFHKKKVPNKRLETRTSSIVNKYIRENNVKAIENFFCDCPFDENIIWPANNESKGLILANKEHRREIKSFFIQQGCSISITFLPQSHDNKKQQKAYCSLIKEELSWKNSMLYVNSHIPLEARKQKNKEIRLFSIYHLKHDLLKAINTYSSHKTSSSIFFHREAGRLRAAQLAEAIESADNLKKIKDILITHFKRTEYYINFSCLKSGRHAGQLRTHSLDTELIHALSSHYLKDLGQNKKLKGKKHRKIFRRALIEKWSKPQPLLLTT